MKEFDAKCYLELQIGQRFDGSIQIIQSTSAKKIIEMFGMKDAHPVSTPLDNHYTIHHDEKGKETNFPYREAMGSLLFLANGSRPDLCFAVNFANHYIKMPADLHVGLLTNFEVLQRCWMLGAWIHGDPQMATVLQWVAH